MIDIVAGSANMSSLYLQGLLQNVQLIFDTTVEDVLRKKGCQLSHTGTAIYMHAQFYYQYVYGRLTIFIFV